MWIALFPQRKLISQIKELHSKYGLGLFDTRMVARAKGADEDVILEVGDNVLLRKKNDSLAIFQKIGDIWVKVDENLDICDSEDILFSNTHPLLQASVAILQGVAQLLSVYREHTYRVLALRPFTF